jgi:hypothetical protein
LARILRIFGLALAVTSVLAGVGTSQEPVRCRLPRVAASFVGACTDAEKPVAELTIAPPGPSDSLWRGEGRFSYRPSEEPLSVDLRAGGTLRTGTAWFDISDAVLGDDSVEFTYDWSHTSRATATDAAILRSTLQLLSDSTRWNNRDTVDVMAEPSRGFGCVMHATRWTLLCALYDASVASGGEYFHGRPAVDAVRRAITTAGAGRLRHPLTDFNNLPGMTVQGIRQMLRRALVRVDSLSRREAHDRNRNST